MFPSFLTVVQLISLRITASLLIFIDNNNNTKESFNMQIQMFCFCAKFSINPYVYNGKKRWLKRQYKEHIGLKKVSTPLGNQVYLKSI